MEFLTRADKDKLEQELKDLHAKGKEIIKNSGLAITSADDLDDAAQKAVAALK